MKILSNVTMAGNVDMSSTNKDTFTIGSELERDNPNADELKVWANANFYNDVQLGSSSVDVTSVKGEFRTSGSIYLDGQTSTIYLGQQDFVDYVTTNLNGLKQSEVTGAGVGIISDQDPSKYYLKSFVGDLDRINVTSENNNSEIHIELAPQQYDYSVLTPSTGTLGSGETSQSEAFYLKNNDTQNVTHSLPDAQTFVKRLLVVKNISTQYSILLNASGSQLIDGNSSLTLPVNTSYTLQAIDDSGYKWKIVGSTLDQTAWTSYTPTWTAGTTNPAIGNGTIEGYYKVIGKTCFVRGNIAMGSTTTFGSGEWYVSMPFTASHADAILMTVNLLDNGSAWYNATLNGARAGFNTKAPMQYQNTSNGTADSVTPTQPFTWTNTDRFIWNGSYEIA